tara:strand:- start:3080 stop:3376 length:297 start_codon:yes stop_codon:yes gene_type:complete
MILKFDHLNKDSYKKYGKLPRDKSSSKASVVKGIKTIVCDLYIARGLNRGKVLEVFHPTMHSELSRYMDGLDSGKADLHFYTTRKKEVKRHRTIWVNT